MRQSLLTKRNDMAALRESIESALHHMDHVLPGQGPILDFVHHNTLHGYQHLPFEEALAASEALTGIRGYLPESLFREFYQQGRITEEDLSAAFAHDPKLRTEQPILTVKGRTITRKDICRIALLFDLQALTASQLQWRIEELGALDSVQPDVPEAVRKELFFAGKSGPDFRQLWTSILNKLGLQEQSLHPENMLDLSLEQAEQWLAQVPDGSRLSVHQLAQQQATAVLDELLAQVGEQISLRGFISALSGVDVFEVVRPLLIRICASVLDEGIAAWNLPERSELGLYAGWRKTLQYDANPFLHELPDWPLILEQLQEDAVDTIIVHLTHLEIPESRWEGYLQRLALELPGWSGMINWRQQHPHYKTANRTPPKLADYLAIRLTLDRVWLNQVCRDIWKVEAKLGALESYFRKNLSEFMVRRSLFLGELPEYLTQQAESLICRAGSERHNRKDWQLLSDRILTWQLSPLSDNSAKNSANNCGWRLFRLCQHLGLSASTVDSLTRDDMERMRNVLNEFSATQRSIVWLYAYERNYREDLFQALHANRNRGRWARREQRPEAQIIFCMDEREESFRRHLEELNPAIETLGAAGFFGVPMNYKGLDDTEVTPLCPIIVTPAHEVQELPRTGDELNVLSHNRGRKVEQWFVNTVYQGLRRNLFLSHPLIDAIAPFTLAGLVGKSLMPKTQAQWIESIDAIVSPQVNTQLLFTSEDNETVATPENPKLGFTESEQADRVAGFLRNTGLTYGLSKLVVIMGHGSISQNNPHMAAYDCGACSGRHGGPNARVFAAMANRPEIRKLLAERGITIPADTWFIGAEHNTCNEQIIWYDLCDVPAVFESALQKLKNELLHVRRMSAHERCRRLASSPRNPTPVEALEHIEERAADFSQVRPELGHVTNASAVVGRRSLTQGVFFDRRVFLISYDPTQDPDGKIVEGILLAVGPVGAGINLEYYFSTVDNDRLGCGSKVPHNVTGLFGVMEGAGSDLRTGLPRQMVEIHEAMRLQVVVEAKTSVLEQIYHRQESLRELIAGGWIHLSAVDPDTGEIFIFERGQGFVLWQAQDKTIPVRANSPECYRGQTLPIPPVLIKQPDRVRSV
jgi:uncharacterized protein YbcC (UPF0753/DUF2309 family)